MGGLPLPIGDFFPINLVLYISVPFTNYVIKKKKFKNKIIIDFFLFTH